jgi:glycine cleavage system H protein
VFKLVKVNDSDIIEGIYYSEDWAWIKLEDNKVRIGITDYAQKQLNEIVYAELPNIGDKIIKGESFGVVESVKSVSDLVSPLSGEVIEVNNRIIDSPEILNEDPYNNGWIVIISPSNLKEELKTLMDFKKALEWYKVQ